MCENYVTSSLPAPPSASASPSPTRGTNAAMARRVASTGAARRPSDRGDDALSARLRAEGHATRDAERLIATPRTHLAVDAAGAADLRESEEQRGDTRRVDQAVGDYTRP